MDSDLYLTHAWQVSSSLNADVAASWPSQGPSGCKEETEFLQVTQEKGLCSKDTSLMEFVEKEDKNKNRPPGQN